MSDEEIITFWKQGWSIDKIAHNFPSVRFREDKEPSWQMYNRVESVILEYQNNYGRKKNMNEDLEKIQIMMNNFSKRYGKRIESETIKTINLDTKETSYIYDLKIIKEEN